MKVIEGLYYTKDHEWVKVEGDKAYIGITDFAQDSLGSIVYVELPEIDDEIPAGDVFGVIESVKAASDSYMPISGTVVDVNEEPMDDPTILNSDPYKNWLIQIEMSDKEELDELMKSDEYEKYITEEA